MAALLEGTWSTGWHPASLEIATVKAAGLDLNAPEDGDWNTIIEAAKTFLTTLRFAGGQFVIFNAADNGPVGEGWSGTYVVTDDHTIVATANDGSSEVVTYHFTLAGTQLMLQVHSETDRLGLVAQTGVLGTLPFTRQPAASAAGASPTNAVVSPSVSSLLPEGTYATAPIPVAALLATVKAAGQDPTQWQLGDDKTVVFTLRFQAGEMVFFFSHDGSLGDVGWHGTYTVADDQTILATDDDSPHPVITYHFTLVGPTLTMRFVGATVADASGLAHQIGIFDTAPFIKQP